MFFRFYYQIYTKADFLLKTFNSLLGDQFNTAFKLNSNYIIFCKKTRDCKMLSNVPNNYKTKINVLMK